MICTYIHIYVHYVYIYIYIYIHGRRPHMHLPQGPLRDIADIMLRYVSIYMRQKTTQIYILSISNYISTEGGAS